MRNKPEVLSDQSGIRSSVLAVDMPQRATVEGQRNEKLSPILVSPPAQVDMNVPYKLENFEHFKPLSWSSSVLSYQVNEDQFIL